MLGTILLVVGSFWALIGFANCGSMFTQGDVGTGIATFGLIFNTVLFVLPGLNSGGMGSHLRNKQGTGRATCPHWFAGVAKRAIVCPNCNRPTSAQKVEAASNGASGGG